MPVDTIYLVPGNHDDPDILTYTCQRSHVLSGSSLVNFGPFKLGVAHQPQNLPPGADFGLYGHSPPDKPPANSGRPLSGLQSINVLLANGNIYSIPYPRGTDVARGIKIRPPKSYKRRWWCVIFTLRSPQYMLLRTTNSSRVEATLVELSAVRGHDLPTTLGNAGENDSVVLLAPTFHCGIL